MCPLYWLDPQSGRTKKKVDDLAGSATGWPTFANDPIIKDGLVYVGRGDKKAPPTTPKYQTPMTVAVFDANTGALKWRTEVLGLNGAPVVGDDGTVFVANVMQRDDDDGGVNGGWSGTRFLALKNGDTVWRSKIVTTGTYAATASFAENGKLYAKAGTDMYTLSQKNGKVLGQAYMAWGRKNFYDHVNRAAVFCDDGTHSCNALAAITDPTDDDA